MRVSMEALMFAAGVDVVLLGHLHEYERTASAFVSQSCPLPKSKKANFFAAHQGSP